VMLSGVAAALRTNGGSRLQVLSSRAGDRCGECRVGWVEYGKVVPGARRDVMVRASRTRTRPRRGAFVFGYAGSVRVAGTIGRSDAAAEPTGTYSRRVPAARGGPATPGNLANRSRMPSRRSGHRVGANSGRRSDTCVSWGRGWQGAAAGAWHRAGGQDCPRKAGWWGARCRAVSRLGGRRSRGLGEGHRCGSRRDQSSVNRDRRILRHSIDLTM
jgi:hypothetical protein